jgi:hypothetical protein
MAAQLIGAERRLAEFGRGRAAAGRVQVGQVARRRRAPGAEARPDSEAGRAGRAGSASLAGWAGRGGAASLAGGANSPGPGGLAGLSGVPGRGGQTGLVSGAGLVRAASLAEGDGRGGRFGLVRGAGPVRADAAIRPGKGRHWGSISARRAWPLQRFNDICTLARLTWGK